MTDLIVDYAALPDPRAVTQDEEIYLDRRFLSANRDLRLSRAPYAPVLRRMDGDWWLINCDDREASLAVFVGAERRRFAVGQRCAFPLPEGESEIHVWNSEYRVGVIIQGTVRRAFPDRPAGAPTVDGSLPDADDRVRDLFQRKHRTKLVLIAYCWEYFTSGINPPQPTHRSVIRKCLGLTSLTGIERALTDISTAIWGEPLHHRHDIAPHLIRHQLLQPTDLELLPHQDCDHVRRSSSGTA
jgi:hypothetical protein